MDQASKDSFWIADKMFGTPDAPKLPACFDDDEEFSGLVSIDNLRRASGAEGTPERGLYAQHCGKCHGTTGNGRGSIAAVQNPYPRDYRMGVFKFKSTPRSTKPTKADLARLIKHGIGGTAMVKIPELTDADIDALVDYVIYLSMRGEVERAVVDSAMFDGILEDGERILNTEFATLVSLQPELIETLEAAADEDEDTLDSATIQKIELWERYEEDWEYAEDFAIEAAESWLEAEDEAIEAGQKPESFPVAESHADAMQIRGSSDAQVFNESVEKGRQLYLGKVANCSKCHGVGGLGDGQVTDYDDWTKDWTVRVNLDPKDRDSLIPLLARGAMEPHNVIPRNFSEGIYRGGKSSLELYRRITQGIDGTPMPAATFIEGQFDDDDVWHIINFLRTLEEPES